MRTDVLERHYAAIGARLEAIEGGSDGRPWIDIRTDRRGERFVIGYRVETEHDLEVIHVDRTNRHLLLLMRRSRDDRKSKFLCGFDERHWFVAAVPEDARGVTDVATAKAALQPELVHEAVSRSRPKDRFRRRNSAYIRQGEWFFVPTPELDPPASHVIRDEALSRGRGKPHIMERAFRSGGTLVYVSWRSPSGITQGELDRLPEHVRREGWRPMTRGADVYAAGAIRHPDHATVHLNGWHRVAMNTEQRARAMQHVVFLD
jgi:hypothetical protein